MSIDVDKLINAVKCFKTDARPSNGVQNAPATIADINNVISKTATVLNAFISELAKLDDE